MNKRANLALAFLPALLFSLLLFLSSTRSVSGESGAVPSFQGATEIEPNDTITTANSIGVNLTMRGRIPATQTGDIDWFRLTLSSADLGREFRATLDEAVPHADYRLELSLYDSAGDIISSNSGQSSSSLEWTASVLTYFLKVDATEFDTVSPVGDAVYDLTVIRFAADPTSTATATPVPWDSCEINDNINGTWPGGPCQLSVGMTKEDLNFVPYSGQPAPNDDFFFFLAKAGRIYRMQTVVSGGADTIMTLYDPSNNPIVTDDDSGVGAGSLIERTLSDGWYKGLVRDRLGNTIPVTAHVYDILIEDVTPATPTPTSTPAPGTVTATPTRASIPGQPDSYEPNYDFSRATLIGLGSEYRNLNFVPWVGTAQDNDFYKLWVVAGKLYICETFNLGTATNTNMILYSAPGFEYGFAGNDDVQPFDPDDPYRSKITFFSSYNGYIYILLGQVGADRILPEEWANLSYGLRCFIDQPGTATVTPTSQFVPPPTSTPQPTFTPGLTTPLPVTVLPSPTPLQLVVLPMTTPTPPPAQVPAATPTPVLYLIDLVLYYDRDGNSQPGPGEGIVDVLARAYDALSGELVSIDYTDQEGSLRFTIPGASPVRVTVPYFGFDQVVATPTARIQIRVAPWP